MFLPIGDSPNPSSTPWVTRILIGINAAVFLLVTLPLGRGLSIEDLSDPQLQDTLTRMWTMSEETYRTFGVSQRSWLSSLSLYDIFVFSWGYKPADPSLVDLLASLFLHGGLMHLAGNMLFLWIFGDNVEDKMGRLPFLLTYLVTGVIATLFFAMLNLDSSVPLVGASGAISGVLGLYLVWFPRNQVKVFIFLGIWFIDVILVPALWVLLFYLVIDNLLPFFSQSESSVAYGAHIGGFVAGVLVALFWSLRRGEPLTNPFQNRPGGIQFRRGKKRPGQRAAQPARPWSQQPPVESSSPGPSVLLPEQDFARLVAQNRIEQAWDSWTRHSDSPTYRPAASDVFLLAAGLLHRRETELAEKALRAYLRGYPRGADLDQVHLALGMVARSKGRLLAAREHYLAALDVSPPGSATAKRAQEALRALPEA